MSILTVRGVSHGFGDRAILEDVSFRLLKGEHIGLIGANGEGKSSFMNIITGKIEPDEGTIEWSRRVRTGYLDQHSVLSPSTTIRQVLQSAYTYLYEMEEEMNQLYVRMGQEDPEQIDALMQEAAALQETLEQNDFYIIDTKIEETAQGLGLSEIGLERMVDALSGGQRTKVLLAKLLLEKPDILLLDEPTNYLDEAHINWLTRYLQSYDNAFLLISHDLPFLNSVINLVYHMENKKLERYPGNYDDFLPVYEMRKQQREAAYQRQQQEISQLQDFVQRNKARVATRNMAMSRQKKLDKMEIIELAPEKPKPSFHFQYSKAPGKVVFEAQELVIGYDQPLSNPINLTAERGKKIALIGANGLGKTTLLKTILGKIKALEGSVRLGENLEVGYFEQEFQGKKDNTCLQEVWNAFPSLDQREVRAALAKCGLTTKHIESQIRVLSGGEQAKVRLCKLLGQKCNVLFLDEPTNHLDQDAKEELKKALKEFPGAVLLISHEREFYQDVVSQVIDCAAWSTKID